LVVRWNPGLCRDPQTVSDAVGVGVVGGALRYVVNVAVAEAHLAKSLHIGLLHVGGRGREFHRISEHGPSLLGQIRRTPISVYRRQKVIVLEQTAQTAPMVGDSIVTAVDLTHDQGDQFALHLAQRGRSRHR